VNKRHWTLLAIATMVSAAPSLAIACTCYFGANDTEAHARAVEAFARAEIVVFGVIHASPAPFTGCESSYEKPSSSFNPSGTAVIKVETVLKGSVPDEIVVTAGDQIEFDEVCRRTVRTNTCDTGWSDGESGLWVLHTNPDGEYALANLCTSLLIRTFLEIDTGLSGQE